MDYSSAITSSADGSKLAEVVNGGQIYISSDSGATWVARESNRSWRSVTSSSDGSKLAAVVNNGKIYTSTNSGANWTPRDTDRTWRAITSSADGGKLAAAVYGGHIYTSTSNDYNITVAGGSGLSTTAEVATSISPGPANESAQTVGFIVTNNNNPLFIQQPAIDASGALTFIPGTAAGIATVSVTAIDNGGTAGGGVNASVVKTFTIAVTNTAPTITDVADQTINEDSATGALAITLGDMETIPDDLLMFGRSSNTTLVPDANIVFGGSGANRTVTVTPVANLSGTVTIDLTVSDGTMDGNIAFDVTINPVNDQPSFALSTASITVAGGSGPFSLAGFANAISPGPPNESSQTIAFTVTNLQNSRFTAQPAISPTGALTFTPGIIGSANQVFVSARDNGGTANGGDDASHVLIFTIHITNSAPVNIALSSAVIAENNAPNATVGTLSTTDPNPGNTFTYSFAAGGTDNASFTLAGNTLRLAAGADFETKSIYAIRIRSTDQGGLSVDKEFSVTITNVNEMPVFTKGANQTHFLGTPAAQSFGGWATGINDGDSTVLQTLAFNLNVVSGDTIFTTRPFVSNTGTLSYGLNGTSGTATLNISLTDDATVGGPALTTAVQTFTITVYPPNAPPSFALPAPGPAGEIWTARMTDMERDWWAITSSADGGKLAAVVNPGHIYTSTDAGVSWTAYMTDMERNWWSITSSADGSKLAAVESGGKIHTSSDSGVSWTPREMDRAWKGITSSADGSKLAAVAQNGKIHISNDSGANWMPWDSNRNWAAITSSADGSKLAAVDFGSFFGGQIYTSTDGGLNWMPRETNRRWRSIASSDDGSKLAAVDGGGLIHTSINYGINWMPHETNRSWISITSSSDGSKLAAVENFGHIYTSIDYGISWVPRMTDADRSWMSISASADGSKLAAVAHNNHIYTSVGSPHGITVLTGSGPFSTAPFASNISPGPSHETSQTVSFTVTNDNNSMFTVTGQPAIDPSGMLSFTPSSVPGTAIVTVTAVDSGGNTNGGVNTSPPQTFTITVIEDALAAWRTFHFGSGGNSGNLADPDFDGTPNLVEYAFGLNPNLGDSGQLPTPLLSGGNMTITFTQPPGVSGITYGAEWSTNMITWYPVADTGSGGTHIFSVPMGNYTSIYMRHRITQP